MMKIYKALFLFLLILISPIVLADDTNTAHNIIGSIDFYDIGIRFIIDLVAITILARFIYFSQHHNTDFFFTMMLFNSINFLICILLSDINLEVGFAFGLFAIFSIMRYRTVTLPVKEMGYLFLAVALGLINALANAKSGYLLLISANAFIIFLTFSLEKFTSLGQYHTKIVIFERIDLIKPDKKEELINDLKERTGLDIQSAEIININFLKDIAEIKIRY